MRLKRTIIVVMMALGAAFSVASQVPAGAATAPHAAHYAVTGHVHAHPPGVNCTQGALDYGVGAVTISTDWEPPGSCGWHVRPCLLDSTNTTRCGGFVKATELVSTTPQANGTMASGWLQEYLTAGTQRWCWDVYHPVSTAWHKCSGTGFAKNGATESAGATLLSAQHRTVINSGHLEEASGPALFVGGPSLNYGANVMSMTGGRAMDFETTGGSICDSGGQCYPKGVLRFTSGTNKCAQGNAQDGEIYVAHCTFDFGILWGDKVTNGHHRYINVNASGVVFHYLGSFQTSDTFLALVLANPSDPEYVKAWDWK